MGRSRAVKVARDNLFRSQLSMQLDSEGRLMIKCGKMFKRELAKVLREIEQDARKIVLIKHSNPNYSANTGRLRRSIHAQPIKRVHSTRIQGSVSAGSRLAPYARYVHDGTNQNGQGDPYPITARPGKMLRFWMPSVGTKTTTVEKITRGPVRRGTRPLIRTVETVTKDLGPGIGYRKTVMHPGIKGSRFLTNAAVGVIRRYGGTVKARDGRIIPPSR